MLKISGSACMAFEWLWVDLEAVGVRVHVTMHVRVHVTMHVIVHVT